MTTRKSATTVAQLAHMSESFARICAVQNKLETMGANSELTTTHYNLLKAAQKLLEKEGITL